MAGARYVMGVDFGSTKTNYTLFEADSGELLKSYMVEKGPFFRENPNVDSVTLDSTLPNIENPEKVSAYLGEETKMVLDTWNCVPEQFTGVGMGVAGKVFSDGRGGEPATYIGGNTPVRFASKDCYGQPCINVTGEMRKLFHGKPVIIGNDCNCTGNAQSWYYDKKMGIDPMKTYFMVISTGIGGGGPQMAVDEVGHDKVFGIHPYVVMQCGCGEKGGCLEAYASGTGMPRFAKKFLDLSPEMLAEVLEYERLGGRGIPAAGNSKDFVDAAIASPLAGIGCLRAEDVFRYAALNSERGDPFSRYLVDVCAMMTGNIISNVANIHGLEVVGIGGSVASKNPSYVEKIDKFTNDLIGDESKFSPHGVKVELTPVGAVVSDYGPASLVAESKYRANWVDTMIGRSKK